MTTAREIVETSPDWQLLSRRQARETARSVYLVDGRYVVKKFEIPAAATSFRRPWLTENAALELLAGHGAPRTHGCHEVTSAEGRTAWLVKEYVHGRALKSFEASQISAAAALMADLHRRGVITDDSNVANFLELPDGSLVFLDFGRARIMRPGSLRLNAHAGWELAKFRREGLAWDQVLWREFQREYYRCAAMFGLARATTKLCCALSVIVRIIRKCLQGKPPRS